MKDKKTVKKPLVSAIKKLDSAREKLEKMQANVISALFEQCPNLKSVELSTDQEYDDNNYHDILCLDKVNGVDWDTSEYDANIEYVCDIDEEDEALRSWLVEANLTISEFDYLQQAIMCLDKDYIESLDNMEFKREKYLV